MAKKTEKRWRVKLARTVPWNGIVLSPKDEHEVDETTLAELGDAVIEKTEVA